MKVALDTVNGAASTVPVKFCRSWCSINSIGETPDGLNINLNVGSTHPEALQEVVKESDSAIGLAFDGDSDRLIAVDENGEIVDGDKIMYIIGNTFLKKDNWLKIQL